MFLSGTQRQHRSTRAPAIVPQPQNRMDEGEEPPHVVDQHDVDQHDVSFDATASTADGDAMVSAGEATSRHLATMASLQCAYTMAKQSEADAFAIGLTVQDLAQEYPSVAGKPDQLNDFRQREAALYGEWALALRSAGAAWLAAGKHERAAKAKGKEGAAWEKCGKIHADLSQSQGLLALWTGAADNCHADHHRVATGNAAVAYCAEAEIWHREGNDANAAIAWANQAWACKRLGDQPKMVELLNRTATAWETAAGKAATSDADTSTLELAMAWENAARICTIIKQPERAVKAWTAAVQARESAGEPGLCLENRAKLATALEAFAREVTAQHSIRGAAVWLRAAEAWGAAGNPTRAAAAAAEGKLLFTVQMEDEEKSLQ